ncbi:MAG: GNAT family N-acetyltransferase [Chloroflexi bacterium]|nr:GNAT family N-acetyltransferase [Chloroflexota bacterium]
MPVAPDIADLAARIPAPLRVHVGVPEDVERIVEFQNRYARPAMVTPIATVRRFEAHNPQPKRLALMVEDERGDVIAVGMISDGGAFARKDGSFSGGVRVAPEHRHHGVGTALLERLEEHARTYSAPRITGSARGDEPDGVRFAERHGYRETNRRINSFLDVPAFDLSRFEDPEAVARRAGVRLVTYSELERERAADVDGLQREVYELGVTAGQDIPRPEPIQMPPYEAIREMFFGATSFDRGSTILALRGGRIVSETLTDMRSPGVAYTNFTGTVREERGKGLALALKLRAIAELKRQGARLFGTTNDEQNAAMRGVNAKLGYEPDPPVIELEKRIS